MNKILFALAILGSGGGAFIAARQSTILVQTEATSARSACITESQLVVAAQGDRMGLAKRVRDCKEILSQPQVAGENALWSALQTNGGELSPQLREHLFEELGLNWASSKEYVLVSKATLREVLLHAMREDKLSDLACSVLAISPEEREKVESAMERARVEFKDWALSHTEREEPKGDVVAQYTLANDPAMAISNNFAAGLREALGRQRAEIILGSGSTWDWLRRVGRFSEPVTMIVSRYLAGAEQRFQYQELSAFGTPRQWGARASDISSHNFPPGFLPLFPNGWADVAKREGFELPPTESEEK